MEEKLSSMFMDEKLSDAIWREGLRRLADEIKKEDLDLLVVAEMMDQLLFETSYCQDPDDIAEIMAAENIGDCDVLRVARIYSIVDSLRTRGEPMEYHRWSDEDLKEIKEKAESSLQPPI